MKETFRRHPRIIFAQLFLAFYSFGWIYLCVLVMDKTLHFLWALALLTAAQAVNLYATFFRLVTTPHSVSVGDAAQKKIWSASFMARWFVLPLPLWLLLIAVFEHPSAFILLPLFALCAGLAVLLTLVAIRDYEKGTTLRTFLLLPLNALLIGAAIACVR